MSRQFYTSAVDIFNLFSAHPVLSQMYTSFGVSSDGIMAVAYFLVNNDAIIAPMPMQKLTIVSSTYSPDNSNPIKATVDLVTDLPLSETTGAIYYVSSPYPGLYYQWTGAKWIVDPQSVSKTVTDFLTQLDAETGYGTRDTRKPARCLYCIDHPAKEWHCSRSLGNPHDLHSFREHGS